MNFVTLLLWALGSFVPAYLPASCQVLDVLVVRAFAASNGGAPYTEKPDARVTRHGDWITWKWVVRAPGDPPMTLELTSHFGFSLDTMKRVYESRSHRLWRSNRGEMNYNDFIGRDPFATGFRELAAGLARLARLHGLPRVEVAVDFVQSLPYQAGMGDYQKFGIETAIDGMGDCSDKTVLLAGILRALRRPVVLISFPDHVAVGIRSSQGSYSGTYWELRRGRYYFCETTVYNATIGWCPDDYRRRADIYEVL